MQFIKHGPDVPERLLQLHEEGKVVFFCGAGISVPAGLPSFWELVDDVFEILGVTPDPLQRTAINSGQYDTALGLLESSIPEGRKRVRHAVNQALTPKESIPIEKAQASHKALLTLSTTRKKQTRLITTNFDRIFENILSDSESVESFKAPLLPIPKNKWNGLVYLHGLLSESPTVDDLNRLVLSSGDFGLAYLHERWAARFVSELLRNYTVCFVGYSINDPVLRYMMDALAADQSLGEFSPEMFAFASYTKGGEDNCEKEWKAKNVTPILYNQRYKHRDLHKTIQTWANVYRDGVSGKTQIVAEYALARPVDSSRKDDYVGRLIWALSDPSGVPAKHFANLAPVPALEWLEFFDREKYEFHDLPRFGVYTVSQNTKAEKGLRFSLVRRPAPINNAAPMQLAGRTPTVSLDKVMENLARWLSLHLNDPELLFWVMRRGGHFHPFLSREIENQLDSIDKMVSKKDANGIAQLLERSSTAIPSPAMSRVWRLLLAGTVKTGSFYSSLYGLESKLLTSSRVAVKQGLINGLMPKVSIQKPLRYRTRLHEADQPERLRDTIDAEVVLSSDHVHGALEILNDNSNWKALLPELLPDFTALLLQAMELKHELELVTYKSDYSYVHQPSIADHDQNSNYNDWTALILLCRNAFVASIDTNLIQAKRTSASWNEYKFPIFKRLAFFTATFDSVVAHGDALSWLLSGKGEWLWSSDVQVEAMKLLTYIAPKLCKEESTLLVETILSGPLDEEYKARISKDDWEVHVAHKQWLRLERLDNAGLDLGAKGYLHLREIKKLYPWKLAEDDRNDFPMWSGGGEDLRSFTVTPKDRHKLVTWVKENPAGDIWKQDDWRDRCRKNFPTTSWTLHQLSLENCWAVDRWRDALQVWSETRLIKKSWQCNARTLQAAPDDFLNRVSQSLSWWLEAIASNIEVDQDIFFNLCQKISHLEYDAPKNDGRIIDHAINHPIGHITTALLKLWYQQGDSILPDEIKQIFSQFCDVKTVKFRYARVTLARHIVSLCEAEPEWTKEHLVPLFDWRKSEIEAQAAWDGFLMSPRLYRPLIEQIKKPFLNTAGQYDKLKLNAQYASILTIAGIEKSDTFTNSEIREAINELPSEGLCEILETIIRSLDGAGEQHEQLWDNRVQPFIHKLWPKSTEVITTKISKQLARLCLAANTRFHKALSQFSGALQVIEHSDYTVHQLHSKDLCRMFPVESLDFLDKVVDLDAYSPASDLSRCLEQIKKEKPELEKEYRYQSLLNFSNK